LRQHHHLYEEDLKKLEEISIRISNLINNNEYEKILELDTHRKRIIKEISKLSDSTSKNQISKIINLNKIAIRDLETEIVQLNTNHNKFQKRIKFYSLSK
tara:strand:- start:607 stop:906 length:300 start_codon:yes stop_codon:yes gene_type:complete